MSVKLFRRPLKSWLGILVLGLFVSVAYAATTGPSVQAIRFNELRTTEEKVKAFYLYQGWQDCINAGYMKKSIPVADITNPTEWETSDDWVSVGYVVEPEDGRAGCDTIYRDGLSIFGLSGDKSGFLTSLGYVSETVQGGAQQGGGYAVGGTFWKFQGCVIPPQGSSGPTRSGTEDSDLASCFRKTIISKFGEPSMTTEMLILRNKTTLDKIGVHFRKTTNISTQDAWLEFSNQYPSQYGTFGSPILKIAVVNASVPSVSLVPYYAGANFSLDGDKFELGSIDNGATHERATARQILDALNDFYSRQNNEITAAIVNGTFDADAYARENQTLDSQGPVEEERTCAIDGIGWIVCGIMKAVSSMNDLMYSGVESMLLMNPLAMTDEQGETPAYKTWKDIRDIANALLVVAFLIIIFSQLTSLGVSNYGIKKTLPRIIIVALAINLSFFVMMVAVDAINIIGVGLHDMISGYANNAWNAATVSGEDVFTWEYVVGIILSGGAVAGAGIAIAAFGPTAIGMMALPFVLGAVLAIIAAFITLALRNALVIVLAIVAPLAFAAFLLPNTKNLFTRWQKLLTSMLFLYPMAALLFSGAKLAGAIVMGLGGTLNLMFGLFIAAAPLFMLPWLARSSGGILGKVGTSLNKMGRSIQGRAQKGLAPMVQQRKDERRAELAAGERSLMFGRRRPEKPRVESPAYKKAMDELRAGRREGESEMAWNSRRQGLIARTRDLSAAGARYEPQKQTVAQRLALGRAARDANIARLKKQPGEQLKELAEMSGRTTADGVSAMEQAGYSRGAQRLGQRAAATINAEMLSDTRAKATDARIKQRFEADPTNRDAIVAAKAAETSLATEQARTGQLFEIRNRDGVIMQNKAAEAGLKAAQDATGQRVQELSTATGAAQAVAENPELAGVANELQIAHTESQVAQMATDSAKRIANQEFSHEIIGDQGLAQRAGGVDPEGATRAISRAQSVVAAAREESIGNIVNQHKLEPRRSAAWHLARLGDPITRKKLADEGRDDILREVDALPPLTDEEAAASIRRIKDIGGAGDVANLARLTPLLGTDQARDEAKGVIAAKLGDKMPVFMTQMSNMGNGANNPNNLDIFNEEQMWASYVNSTSYSVEDFAAQPLQRDELIKFATSNAGAYADGRPKMSPETRELLRERLESMRAQIEASPTAKEKIAPKAIENMDKLIETLRKPPVKDPPPQPQP